MIDTVSNTSQQETSELMPVLYLPHGGGPLPLMGDSGHKDLIAFLTNAHKVLPKPKAILMISGHWESDVAAISSSPRPKMMYDYSGFPQACYQYQYPADGNPELASTVADLLKTHYIACKLDAERGYDHGTFVPLMLMYPKANVPVVQLSLLHSLDPAEHIALGEAIAPLREQGVLIIGSGMSYHERDASFEQSVAFDDWLTEAMVSHSVEATHDQLVNWTLAPAARDCHRREDHLLPLHVCFGAAKQARKSAQKVYAGLLFGRRIAGFLWR